MARKKNEEEIELNISKEQFRETRDSVLMALASVQKGLHNVSNNLNELMHAYIKHTASVLSGEDGALEGTQLSESAQNMVDEADLATKSVATLTKSLATPVAESGDADAGKGKKRKREKKIKDPNAPKRPLTAAFLYAQSARPIIRKDLENDLPAGARLEPNAINIEVNKRWSEMSEEDKEKWKASYRESMEVYTKEVAAYKAAKGAAAAGEPIAEDDASEVEAGALDSDDDADSDDASDDEPSPAKAATPPPTFVANGKTPRANKRQKTAAAHAVNGTAAAGQTPVPPPASKAHSAVPAPAVATVVATPAKKDRKKKDAKVTPAAKESSPEEPKKDKKEKKTGRATRATEAEGEEKTTKKRDRSKRKSEAGAA